MMTSEIKRFSNFFLKQKLGAEYRIITARDLVRMRGPFAQSVLLATKRSGYMHIIPTFYLVGAEPSDVVMFQTMSLPISGIDADRRWSVCPEAKLDEMLAEQIIQQLEKDSPLSFKDPLTDFSIHQALTKFSKTKDHWKPSLALAYWEILTGAKSAADTLKMSRQKFIKYSRFDSSKEPTEQVRMLMARHQFLQQRLDSANGIHQCRAEVEEHAAKLKLPKINWPMEWPR